MGDRKSYIAAAAVILFKYSVFCETEISTAFSDSIRLQPQDCWIDGYIDREARRFMTAVSQMKGQRSP